MDITKSTEPKSDQQNFDDYAAGPKTVTVKEVKKGNAEQPVEVHLVEFPGRPFKPSKSMRRVLVAAWGPEASVYAGRRMTLYGDPTVKFGGQEVGGIRISHLSDIPETLTIGLTVTRGKRTPFIVNPIDDSGRDWLVELAALNTVDEIAGLGADARAAGASAETMAKITAAYHTATSHREEVGDGDATTNDPTPPGSLDPASPDVAEDAQ